MRGSNYVKMPALRKIVVIKDRKVAELIVKSPSSKFFGASAEDVRQTL